MPEIFLIAMRRFTAARMSHAPPTALLQIVNGVVRDNEVALLLPVVAVEFPHLVGEQHLLRAHGAPRLQALAHFRVVQELQMVLHLRQAVIFHYFYLHSTPSLPPEIHKNQQQ